MADSLLFLFACIGFLWVVVWSLRDFTKPSKFFWLFDAQWMDRVPEPEKSGWRQQASRTDRRT